MEYDSILKEKKVYEDPVVHHNKYTKYVLLYILSLIIILIVSYIVYYRSILSPSNIFLQDISVILEKYQKIPSYLIPENMKPLKNIEGTINFNTNNYNYSVTNEQNNFIFEISNQENYLLYQKNNNQQYLEISELTNKKIHLNKTLSIDNTNKIKQTLKTYLTNDKFLKHFYIENKMPIVEVNIVLTTNDINNILGINLKEQYELTFTLKNHAITNEIINLKLVVNNKTKNKRSVYTYDSKNLYLTNNNRENYKITLTTNKDDFNLKIYQDDILYSIFLGKKLEKTYQYTYQVIDKVYNITLNVSKEDAGYQYKLTSNIERDGKQKQQEMKILLSDKKDTLLEERDSKVIEYNNLTKEDKTKYNEFLDNFLSPFRKFINEYKDDINKFNQNNKKS